MARIVCLSIEFSDREGQDLYLYEHIKALLEDECIDAELFWADKPESRISVPERPYGKQKRSSLSSSLKSGISKTENAFYGLEILKYSVLLVLYQYSKPLSQKEIREHLKLRRVGKNNNFIRGVLEYLEEEGYVEYKFYGRGQWQITDSGMSFIVEEPS